MLQPFLLSIIIAVSTCAAFAGGRLVALVARRVAVLAKAIGIGVALIAVAFAALFATNGSSRYALLLPAAFAIGFFNLSGFVSK